MKTLLQRLRLRKRTLLSSLCLVMLVYAGVQFYVQDEYSPLQLLSSVENEATRLLRFISQTQVHCNDSVAVVAGNSSRWMICLDQEIGVPSLKLEDQKTVVYSVGPERDFGFEQIVSWNLSTVNLFIFCHQRKCSKEHVHANPGRTSFYKIEIVPNDPADFARNSFESQTLNAVMKTLQHETIDLLKLDSFIETVESFDVLRFLIYDSALLKVNQLHFVITLDKVEEDFIYSWYRVLYALFNTAGFRLFHISASDPLCLQDTVMESCRYYLSWMKRPPPHVFIMYPPAIDGSLENEEDRLLNYLHSTKPSDNPLVTVPNFILNLQRSDQDQESNYMFLKLSSAVMEREAKSCNVILIRSMRYSYFHPQAAKGCKVHSLSYVLQRDGSITFHTDSMVYKNRLIEVEAIQNILTSSDKNIVFIDVGQSWQVLSTLSNLGLPTHMDQVTVLGHVLPTRGRLAHTALRTRFSELKRLEEFSLALVHFHKVDTSTHLDVSSSGDLYSLSYVKHSYL